MSIKFLKLGQIYDPRKKSYHSKLLTHASNPVPVLLNGDVFRIFYSARDSHNRSSVGALDFDIIKRKILKIHKKPIVTYDSTPSYFSDGISLGNLFKLNNKKAISFMGWRTMEDGSWKGEIGFFSLTNKLFLDKVSPKPIIQTDTDIDPISLSYPWILETRSSNFLAWYGSTIGHDKKNSKMIHAIHKAHSNDGLLWKKDGLALSFQNQKLQMMSRPSISFNESGDYEMWFSYRSGNGDSYRIRLAESADGEKWSQSETPDLLNISNSGWDSEMIEYPYVFIHKKKKYMLYNGNGFGKTGFGLAQLIYEK